MRVDAVAPPPSAGHALSATVAMFLLAVAAGGLHLLDTAYPMIVPSTGAALAIASALLCGATAIAFRSRSLPRLRIGAFELGLLLLLISDFPRRQFSLFQFEWSRAYLIACCLLSLALARRPIALAGSALAAALAAAWWGFGATIGGRMLFSDDHPAFLYRLVQLKESFPSIPFYNPLWNGGVEAREFFPSGILNLFTLFSPFIYLFDPVRIYGLLVAALLFAIVPGSILFAARRSGAGQLGAYAAGCLSLASSLFWYRWGLVFGTMGFITSMSLLPACLALCSRLLDPEEPFRARDALITTLCCSLVLFWSPAALVLIPAVLYGAARARAVIAKPWALVAIAALCLISAPWMALFVRTSKVAAFVTSTGSRPTSAQVSLAPGGHHKAAMKTQAKPLKIRLRETAQACNPLVLCLGLPGLLMLGRRTERRLLAGTCAWLLALGLLGPLVKPQLELDRMLVALCHLLTIPTGAAVGKLLSLYLESPARLARARAGLSGGMLLLTPVLVWHVVTNRTPERFHLSSGLVESLSGAIKQHAGDGRTLFAGFILHELDGGHVAILPHLTGKPLIASSYQHDRWRYTDVIPDQFRSTDDGIEKFMDLYNVTAVVTHDSYWRKAFTGAPGYSRVWHSGAFSLFTRQSDGSYFIQGSGSVVDQSGDTVRLLVDTPRAVVKFNYHDFLRVNACELSSHVENGLSFVALAGCPRGVEVVIASVGPIERLLTSE